MSWREVIITGHAKLDYKMDYLVVRKQDGTDRVYIPDIGFLMIESTRVSLTTTLISELVKNKVKIIFCDANHNPQSELLPYHGSHDTSLKVREQVSWSDEIKQLVWTEIVKEKIKNQMELLEEYQNFDRAELLKTYIEEMEPGDQNNREGHAAKVYFNTMFGIDFTRNDENTINAALNYGYNILLSCFNREIVSNGYLTQIGLWHSSRFNSFNLASDLMEPFRILVDRKVLTLNLENFDSHNKYELVSILNGEVRIDSKVSYVNNAIKLYCKSIFESLHYEDTSYIKFYTNEL